MDISLGRDNTLYMHGRDVMMAIGPELSAKTDVFFTTKGVEPKAEAGKYFQGAGEYEVQGVMVDGVATGQSATSYHVLTDNVNVAAVALHKAEDLTDEMLERLQPSHVLVLWLEEGSAQDVAQLMSRFDVNQLIPARVPCDLEALEKELQLQIETTPKLKLAAKNYADGVRLLTALST